MTNRMSHSAIVSELPALPRNVHFMGICGRMVGGMALALQKLGVRVSGSDVCDFPPMPGHLRTAGIRVTKGWKKRHLPRDAAALVTGPLVHRWKNPELEAAMDRGMPVWNATAFLEHHFLLRSENFVVAGTKGKTTTTAMLAWILEQAGVCPDYLIGGQVRNAMQRVKLTGSPVTVLEGDEYRCGSVDPLPKFLRYHPRHVVVTNIHHDHQDMYATPRDYGAVFRHLVDMVPRQGSLTLNADDPGALALAGRTPTPTETVGFSRRASRRITHLRVLRSGTVFRLAGKEFRLQLAGRMNAHNAALAAVAARGAGVSLKMAADALRSFPGVEGRQEVIRQDGKTFVYTDEAFLPVAMRPLLESLKARHPGSRLVVLFQPRYTGGRDGVSQRDLPECLAQADVVLVSPALEVTPVQAPFDHRRLCRDVSRRGARAHPVPDVQGMLAKAPALCREGDIVLISFCMGNEDLTDQLGRTILDSVSRR